MGKRRSFGRGNRKSYSSTPPAAGTRYLFKRMHHGSQHFSDNFRNLKIPGTPSNDKMKNLLKMLQ